MGSSGQPDRSLGGGISLPQWMKNKMDARLDFDESAFSPPAYDDNFFYVRHSRNENPASIQQGGFRSIGEIPSERKNGGGDVVTSTNQATSDLKSIKQIDFSKHPLPCQPFVPSASDVKPPKLVVAGSAKIKSQGTDDGFHSEPALCGKYIVHVANQLMMSSKIGAVSSKSHNEEVESVPKMGSKSLPATPLTSPMTTPDISPKVRRKLHSNRYFTGPFVPDREKYQGGWILASLLGQSRDIFTTKIEEEEEEEEEKKKKKNNNNNGLDIVPPKSALNRKKSISSQNLTYISKEEKSAVYTNVFQAKPSELREMNFWSPTSM